MLEVMQSYEKQHPEDRLYIVKYAMQQVRLPQNASRHELPCSLRTIISGTKSSEVHYAYRAERLVWASSVFGQSTAMVPVVHQAAAVHLDHNVPRADVTMKAIEPKVHLNRR